MSLESIQMPTDLYPPQPPTHKNTQERTRAAPKFTQTLKITVRSQNMWVAPPPQMRASINKSQHVTPLTPAATYVNHS